MLLLGGGRAAHWAGFVVPTAGGRGGQAVGADDQCKGPALHFADKARAADGTVLSPSTTRLLRVPSEDDFPSELHGGPPEVTGSYWELVGVPHRIGWARGVMSQVVLQRGEKFWLKVEGEHHLDGEAGAGHPVGC